MRVFVTGASGFVGSAIVQELLKAGHEILGLARTDNAAEGLSKAGAAVHRGDLEDLESLKAGAAQCDAVIHTAFNHDFSKFKANCESDRQVILALGEALKDTNKPMVVTSGIGLMNAAGRLINENDTPPGSDIMPRAASEEAARAVGAYILRLPPTTHGEGDHGFVPMVINMDKEKGEAAYIGAGSNHWPAVHRFDAANLYRLIIEQQPEQKVFHAVAEEGIPFIEIATAIGKGTQLPVVSKDEAGAEAHFGWFKHFASFDCAATSELTRKTLGWEPKQEGLLKDMITGKYF
ncbi:SDR family oxidoreductase [Taibaiella soli]|uniref:3-beta hydroxysteroid dehydrogenase n=1 Tax=Taibaiella soli TaxID=1649169 RepID=A0A2W2AJ89_9BACT|nr:SDR family oxidoreductase [Taibaiella soli]PZF72320.1 3-beta hydroxysteroid dehydrogenase [Taibaiella soli]